MKIKFSLNKNDNVKKNFKQQIIKILKYKAKNFPQNLDSRKLLSPYNPVIKDLYSLYRLIIDNNRTSVLEYGTGWSTLVMHLALMYNKRKIGNNLFPRCEKPFHLISLDNEKKFLSISKKRVKKYSKNMNLVKFSFSKVQMTNHNGKYCTEYKNHPIINPDFIYIDGPDQWNIKKNSYGFSTGYEDFMPMMSDILKYEHFLTPGTIVVIDGRTANARFLKVNFQRNWKYSRNEKLDQNYFILDERPLGQLNKKQLNFYKKKY